MDPTGNDRTIDSSARTIRLPIHIGEKLSRCDASPGISTGSGNVRRLELVVGIEPRELEDLMSQSAPCASLDAHARGEEDRSTLSERDS